MADPYIPTSYFPTSYFPTGYFTEEPSAVSVYAMSSVELDVRLYTAAGLRKFFDTATMKSLDFEVSEKGGYLNGSMVLNSDWEDLNIGGTEYFDVFVWGQRVYRGYVQIWEPAIDDPEELSLTLSGRAETLNGYIVRRCFCYAQKVDISQVYLDIVDTYVSVTGRLPDMTIEAIGVPALGIQLSEFCAKGKSVSQALNALCETAPQQLIWGCDVDDTGTDRLYLLPRSSDVVYRYVIGKNVQALIYPKDKTNIVNKVYVTGGEADPPNLCPNGSFENRLPANENAGNLLLNSSFEDGDGRTATSWNRGYDACRRKYPEDEDGRTQPANYARTGSCWVEMDNIYDGSPEDYTQNEINLGYKQDVNVSVWARQITNGDAERFRFEVLVWDSGGTLLETLDLEDFTPTSDTYQHFTTTLSPTNASASKVSYRVMMMSAGGVGHGILYDDPALWLATPQADAWQAGSSNNGYFASLDWRNEEMPYEGEVNLKAQAEITSGGGYAEINLRDESRINAEAGKVYYVSAYFRGVSADADVKVGIRQYNGADIISTTVSDTVTVPAGSWTRVQMSLTTDANMTRLEPVIRLYDEDAVYIDGVMVTKGSVPAAFYAGANFEGTRSVTDYTAGQIGADAADSITDWGVREKEESVETVKDTETLDAYCISYFTAHATPKIEGKLTLTDPTNASELPGLAGRVQIHNLVSAPDPLFPARIRYRFGENTKVMIDLNNERPDLAALLRKVSAQ